MRVGDLGPKDKLDLFRRVFGAAYDSVDPGERERVDLIAQGRPRPASPDRALAGTAPPQPHLGAAPARFSGTVLSDSPERETAILGLQGVAASGVAPIGGPTYRAANCLMDEIDLLAEVLTGNRRYFWLKPHSTPGSSEPVGPQPDSFDADGSARKLSARKGARQTLDPHTLAAPPG